jgi:hypothetical protein
LASISLIISSSSILKCNSSSSQIKVTHICSYRHECELLNHMLITIYRDAAPSSQILYYATLNAIIQSSLFKCYPYKRYNFIYVKNFLLPYKNTIGKTSECYVLSVVTCSTAFFVNCTSISVNFEKIKVVIYESIHFKHVITIIPYSLQTSQIFSLV